MWRELLTKNEEMADIAVFGIAYDKNCSVSKGARFAPQRIRKNSEFLPPFTVNGDEIKTKVFDYGDIKQYDYTKVKDCLQRALGKKFVLMLGGDHSVSILSQKAYRECQQGKIGLIHIDAHADICDVYGGSKYSHACVNRRALENGYTTADITMIGIRSFEKQEAEFFAKNSMEVYTTERTLFLGADKVLCELKEKYKTYDNVYLSFDIDAVDPSFAPGTGTPEAFGLPSLEVLKLLTGIIKELPVTMMDIVEVSPPLDTNDITVWLALKYILEIFNLIH